MAFFGENGKMQVVRYGWGLMADMVFNLFSFNNHKYLREEMTWAGRNTYLKFITGVIADLLMNN